MDVTLVLTHDCNLGCGYCYAGAKFNRRMSPEIARRCVDLAFSDEPERLQLSFFGGEPLLSWKQLVRTARSARERAERTGAELKMSVTTNGTLLTDDRARTLDELGVYVGLSVDGVREAHDAGRPKMGGGSSFDDVERGLSVLLRRGTSFETISVVTPTNVRWLGDSVRWLLELGVPRMAINPCYEAYFSDEELELWTAGLKEAADAMIACFQRGRLVSMPVFDNKILAALKGGLATEDTCSLGDRSIAVAPGGNVYPCERMVAEDEDPAFRMGHIVDGWAPLGPRCERGPVNDECVDCGERWRCTSHCACANFAETGETNLAGGTQCWHERQTAELADHVAGTLWAEQNALFIAWFYGRMTAGQELSTHAPSDRAERAVKAVPRKPASTARRRLRVVSR